MSVKIGQEMVLFGISVPPLYFFWGIGIVLMMVYYIIFGKRFGLKRWQALVVGLSFLVIETVGAVVLANLEAFDELLKNGPGVRFSLFGIMFSLPLGNLLLAKIFKKNYGSIMDYCAPGILIELALYRVGCTFAGCCGGLYWEYGIPNNVYTSAYPVQPVEAVIDLALAGWLIYLLLRKRPHRGHIYLYFMAGYCTVRFILEFFRVRDVLFLGMSHSHLLCLLFLGIAIALLARQYRKDRLLVKQREREKKRRVHKKRK